MQTFSKGCGMLDFLVLAPLSLGGIRSLFCFVFVFVFLFLSCWSDISLQKTHSFLNEINNLHSLQSAPCKVLISWALGPSCEQRAVAINSPWRFLDSLQKKCCFSCLFRRKGCRRGNSLSSLKVETIAFLGVEPQPSLLDAAVMQSPFADVPPLIFIMIVAHL